MEEIEDLLEQNELAARFEQMLVSGKQAYFDVDDLVILIDYYMSFQNIETAYEVLKFAEKFYPDSNFIKLQRIRMLFYEGDDASAAEKFDALEPSESDCENLDFLLDKADMASQLNHLDTSVTLCKEILKTEPECAEAYIQLCFNYHAQERYEELLESFVRLMAIDDSHENLMFDFSFNFQIKSQYFAAKSLFEKLTEIYPLSKIAWFCLGVSQSALNLHQEAIVSFEFCLSLDEEFAGAYFNLANVYHTMQNYPKAIELYQKTFNFESPDALTYSYIGECYLSLDKIDDAFDAFKNARDLDSELPEMLMGLALCLSEYGKIEAAIHCAEKALTIQPNHAENIFILYELYIENGETAKAEALIDVFCSDSDKLISLYLDFSDILYKNDKKELAYLILERAQAFYPDDYSCTYRLANYCYAEGLTAEALLYLQIALERDFAHRDVFLNYHPDIVNDTQINAILTEYEKK